MKKEETIIKTYCDICGEEMVEGYRTRSNVDLDKGPHDVDVEAYDLNEELLDSVNDDTCFEYLSFEINSVTLIPYNEDEKPRALKHFHERCFLNLLKKR